MSDLPFCPYCGVTTDTLTEHTTQRHGITAEQHEQNLRRAGKQIGEPFGAPLPGSNLPTGGYL